MEELQEAQTVLQNHLELIRQRTGGTFPPLIVEWAERGLHEHPPHPAVEDVHRILHQRLWRVQHELRRLYLSLLKQCQSGMRILLAGETIYWSDIVLEGGDRTQPFDSDTVLDVPTASR